MLFGALALRFSQPPGCGTKALVSNARRKACVPTVNLAECTPVVHFFLRISTYANEQKCGERSSHTAFMLHSSHTAIRKTLTFNRYVACSSSAERMNQVCHKGPDT